MITKRLKGYQPPKLESYRLNVEQGFALSNLEDFEDENQDMDW